MKKRVFDIILSFTLLVLFFWMIAILWMVAAVNSGTNGFFCQDRIGRYGQTFKIFKFRTIDKHRKISRVGNFLRNSKADEFPQLWNVLKGEMSFVGPRPDVPGYYDKLSPEYSELLNYRPGITSPASIKYYDEEQILSGYDDPLRYNDEVIFPDKLKINLQYFRNATPWSDLKIMMQTVLKLPTIMMQKKMISPGVARSGNIVSLRHESIEDMALITAHGRHGATVYKRSI